MDVRNNGKFSGSEKKVTTKVAPIKVEYLFMTKQHYHSPSSECLIYVVAASYCCC
jgi:hypothetical protein